jgi:hypothetical protein
VYFATLQRPGTRVIQRSAGQMVVFHQPNERRGNALAVLSKSDASAIAPDREESVIQRVYARVQQDPWKSEGRQFSFPRSDARSIPTCGRQESHHSVIMKLTGHKISFMFDRYNTVDQDDAKDAMRKLSAFFNRNLLKVRRCSGGHFGSESVARMRRNMQGQDLNLRPSGYESYLTVFDKSLIWLWFPATS